MSNVNYGNRGLLIAVEGVDGAGKSTLIKALSSHLQSKGISNAVFKNHVGLESPFWASYKKSREQLKNNGVKISSDAARTIQTAEFLSFARNVLPGLLSTHRVVLADRYMVAKRVDSRVSLEGNVGSAEILLNVADDIYLPDQIFYLRVPAKTAWKRISNKEIKDWKENYEIISKAVVYYDQIVSTIPDVEIINADKDEKNVFNVAITVFWDKFSRQLEIMKKTL